MGKVTLKCSPKYLIRFQPSLKLYGEHPNTSIYNLKTKIYLSISTFQIYNVESIFIIQAFGGVEIEKLEDTEFINILHCIR